MHARATHTTSGAGASRRATAWALGSVPTWDREEATSWHRAATTACNRILAVNDDILCFVSGLVSGSRLGPVRQLPVQLDVPERLVYVSQYVQAPCVLVGTVPTRAAGGRAHAPWTSPRHDALAATSDYPWWHPSAYGYPAYAEAVEDHWGFIVEGGEAANYTAPLCVSELGTCHSGPECISEAGTPPPSGRPGMDGGRWFTYVTDYLRTKDLDFCYWPLNGSTCKGTGRTSGGEEGYGLLNMCWNAYVYPPLLEILQTLQPPTSGPRGGVRPAVA